MITPATRRSPSLFSIAMKHLDGPIRYGKCIEQYGWVILEYGGIKFIEAAVELDGMMQASRFKDFLEQRQQNLSSYIHLPQDAPWVAGRLQRLFRTTQVPIEIRGKTKFLYFPFLVQTVNEDDQVFGIPIICADQDGFAGVYFSNNSLPKNSAVRSIADAFWSLVAEDPKDCYSYIDYKWDEETGQKFEFGIDNERTPFNDPAE